MISAVLFHWHDGSLDVGWVGALVIFLVCIGLIGRGA